MDGTEILKVSARTLPRLITYCVFAPAGLKLAATASVGECILHIARRHGECRFQILYATVCHGLDRRGPRA
jgi:hypothetical protein